VLRTEPVEVQSAGGGFHRERSRGNVNLARHLDFARRAVQQQTAEQDQLAEVDSFHHHDAQTIRPSDHPTPLDRRTLRPTRLRPSPLRRGLVIAAKTDNTRAEWTTPRPGRTTRRTTPDWQIDHRHTTSEAIDEQLHGPEAIGVPNVQLA
jgi:hypothetical protein